MIESCQALGCSHLVYFDPSGTFGKISISKDDRMEMGQQLFSTKNPALGNIIICSVRKFHKRERKQSNWRVLFLSPLAYAVTHPNPGNWLKLAQKKLDIILTWEAGSLFHYRVKELHPFPANYNCFQSQHIARLPPFFSKIFEAKLGPKKTQGWKRLSATIWSEGPFLVNLDIEV